MSVITARPTRPTRGTTVRTLALVEARRYAHHPIFLTGAALMAVAMIVISKDMAQGTGDAIIRVDADILPAFFLGLLGVFVGVQLTRSMAEANEPLEATPTDGVARATALCLAALVPGVAAAIWLVWIYAACAVWSPPPVDVNAIDLAAIRAAGVVYAVGGPLFGVMVGRWVRLPGAGLLAVVVLYIWDMLSTAGLALPASRFGSLIYLSAPFVSWTSADTEHADPWMAGGSPMWYLVYITLLSALAATAALVHEARGKQRERVIRIFATIAASALVSLAMAVASDPTRTPL